VSSKPSRKFEPKQENANRRAKIIPYLMDTELGADAREIARHAGLSESVVYRELRALRSLVHPKSNRLKLVPIIGWERDTRGSPSIPLYGFGWAFDRRAPMPKSNLEIVKAYQGRKQQPRIETTGVPSVFHLGQAMSM
jgi:hypothetical protein